MSVITIAGDVEARAKGALTWVAASLPATLTLVADNADVRAVNGAAGWAQRASQALLEGASGVLVVDPEAEPEAEAVESLRQIAADLNAFVILDQRWRSNPAVVEARKAVRSLNTPVSFAEVAVTVPTIEDAERALHQSVQIAHHVIGAVENLRILHRQPQTVLVSGTAAGGAPLTISIAVGPAIDLPFHIRVAARSGGVHLSVPDPGTAAPGVVTVLDADGSRTLPSRWESAHRASWRRVIAAFEGGERPEDLREFNESSHLLFVRSGRSH